MKNYTYLRSIYMCIPCKTLQQMEYPSERSSIGCFGYFWKARYTSRNMSSLYKKPNLYNKYVLFKYY